MQHVNYACQTSTGIQLMESDLGKATDRVKKLMEQEGLVAMYPPGAYTIILGTLGAIHLKI
eukprot:6781654-Karenia_brevis.AAC.1